MLSNHVFQESRKGIGYIGYYSSSKASGIFWAGMRGGRPTGHLHGAIDPADGSITGNNISYIYPDMETALLGIFKYGKMQDAQESILLDLECNKAGLLYVSQYSQPDSRSPHYYYEPPNNVSFGSGPQGALDPYEHKLLEIRSANNANMGQGAFARINIKPNTFVSSYNGYVYGKENGEVEIYGNSCYWNVTKSDDERRHCLKYAMNLPTRDATIHIPPEFDQPGSFIPSLGPKVNHNNFSTKVNTLFIRLMFQK